MAIEANGIDTSVYAATADLSGSQFLAVRPSTTVDFQVVLESTGGVNIAGILQNKPKAGQAASVRFIGMSKAIAGAAYSRGALLMTNSSGQFITATSTNVAVAIACEAALAASEVRTVQLLNAGKQ